MSEEPKQWTGPKLLWTKKEMSPTSNRYEVVQTDFMKTMKITATIYETFNERCTWNAKGCVFGASKSLEEAQATIYDLFAKWFVFSFAKCPYNDGVFSEKCLICEKDHKCPQES